MVQFELSFDRLTRKEKRERRLGDRGNDSAAFLLEENSVSTGQ